MSLYNMLFGVHSLSDVLLKILDIEKSDIPRFRDCYILNNNIVIYTRTGGGNRDYYEEKNDDNLDGPWNSTLRESQFYLYDVDECFDPTYAYFFFQFPEKYKEDLLKLTTDVNTHTPSEKWNQLFDLLDKK